MNDSGAVGGNAPSDRIGIVVVAYNAASTLAAVLDRLPQGFRHRVAEVVVCDDASSDCTYTVGKEYQADTDLPLTIIRRPQNLGYGGNQKAAYRWAIEHGLDIVVLLHADGQYAPEVIEDLINPFETTDCDAVFGSRLLDPGSARIGGMPLYKYLGNRTLSKFSNAATGLHLSEWHSGYRAYRVQALKDIPFESNTDGFDFDTEIILQLLEAKKVIVEVPIPTFYGNEICHVNGLGYAKDVVTDVVRYRVHKMGFGSGEMAFADDGLDQLQTTASHRKLLSWMSEGSPKRILDLACGNGRLGELLRLDGHTVIGIDAEKLDGVGERLDGFVEADLNEGIPAEAGGDFDVVVATNAFERVVDPEALMAQLPGVLAPRGVIIASVPNVAHWYPRARVLTGHFDYERRGIFDSGHLRFFTQKSFERMAERAGLRVRRRASSGVPVEVAERGGPSPSRLMRVVAAVDKLGLATSPNLFSYQFLFELEPT
jgi:glycosyltransferase involved in cell wall biosynthesis/ubiquinone/menaquinone biosynthesis C-methylase UbiE